jgi:hypothetical protein
VHAVVSLESSKTKNAEKKTKNAEGLTKNADCFPVAAI